MRSVYARWPGATACVIASGPSVTAEDTELVRAWRDADPTCRFVVVTNSTFLLCPWADILYAKDCQWWRVYLAEVDARFAGLRATVRAHPARFRVEKMQNAPFRQWNNSGADALSVAVCAGATKIIMLGFDMQRTGGRSHHHGDHPHPLGNAASLKRWVPNIEVTRAWLDQQGVAYVNCTRETALKWPRAKLEDALCAE